MIEKIITSKTRVKILNLFITHIDDRYYLRELERKLEESLSPLRRQLIKLVKIGILTTEDEANLKYYKLNKNFQGLEELKKLVITESSNHEGLPEKLIPVESITSRVQTVESVTNEQAIGLQAPAKKKVRYDYVLLTVISIFILIAAIYTAYLNNKRLNQIAAMISTKFEKGGIQASLGKKTNIRRQDEMANKKWKILPGAAPIFSRQAGGQGKDTKEL